MDNRLREILEKSENVVFFGGAGVSTESDIPDFRSEKGLYLARKEYGASPEEILSHHFFMENPEDFFKYYRENLVYPNAKPNKAHRALARWEKEGKVKAIVTQNIDGLHQKAGSEKVYELHGSVERNYCMKCSAGYDLSYIMNKKNCRGNIPICSKCGGIIKPDVVLYGEALDMSCMEGAVAAIEQADTLIIGGTSLVVYPAAGLVRFFSGKHLVLINKQETPYDHKADLVINDYIGKVMELD